jgi:hypothetical protein
VGPHQGTEVNGAGVDISCSPLVSWLLGWKKRVCFVLRKRCVSSPRIGCRRRFRWYVVWHNRIKATWHRGDPGVHRFVTDRRGLLWGCVGFGASFGALAHTARVGAVVASGGVRLPEFPRAAEANQKAVEEGGEGIGPGRISKVGIASAPPDEPAAFGRTARATAGLPLRRPVSTRVVRMPSPQILS